ncbi:MAG: hemolysin III family protein [Clostridia bacterium]|nr:hemolysin III family protein [Clostridia bacterium]
MNNIENTLAVKQKYTLSEELISAISHGIGVLLAIAGMVLCIVKAASECNAAGVVSSSLYGSFMIILYLMSTLYHSFKPTIKAKKVFRIFDHCCIFLLIFGTYLPYTLVTLKGALGWTLFGIVLGAAILGIVVNAVNLEKFKKLSMVCYLVMGWTIIGAIKQVYKNIDLNGLILLVLGGIIYTIGAVIYGLGKKVKYMHSVWHIFVLAGTILQFFSIYLYVL